MFYSVLSNTNVEAPQRLEAPGYFRDLHIDQILDALVVGYEEFDLKPFFQAPLPNVDAIEYRHEVNRDLDDRGILAAVLQFTEQIAVVREHLRAASKMSYELQKKRWFLQATETYVDAVDSLLRDLRSLALQSQALNAFRQYVNDYCTSDHFIDLRHSTKQRLAELGSIDYTVLIRDNRVTVGTYEASPDYSEEIREVFNKFRQAPDREYQFNVSDRREMNHVEARILDLVASMHPQVFASLDEFFETRQDFADETLVRFDREIHFYLAYRRLVEGLRSRGLTFCLPTVSDRDKASHCSAGFDMALAIALRNSDAGVICNDWYLTGSERLIVVTGPNQGGKTTFARMFGQLHHFAAIGCPVPGTDANVLLVDWIFTHFERGENLGDRRGKLQDDLVRIHEIVTSVTPLSLVIINEIFSSTTLQDAAFLARQVAEALLGHDAICICVTFLDELARLGEQTVSMTSQVDPSDPGKRTFKIARRPADGRAYALSVAQRHGLTYESLKARIPS